MEDLARKQLDEISRLTNEVKALRKDLMDQDEREEHNVNGIIALQKERRSQNEKMECQRVTSEERAKALECCIGVCVYITLLFSRMDSSERFG